ncbi:MAG: hypothetical protein LBB05_03565 [Puniceicoccales bacterium]|jgi:chromosome segregation ATPase|nr:hypothetical protein [Puniceicoccales bacterium]
MKKVFMISSVLLFSATIYGSDRSSLIEQEANARRLIDERRQEERRQEANMRRLIREGPGIWEGLQRTPEAQAALEEALADLRRYINDTREASERSLADLRRVSFTPFEYDDEARERLEGTLADFFRDFYDAENRMTRFQRIRRWFRRLPARMKERVQQFYAQIMGMFQ